MKRSTVKSIVILAVILEMCLLLITVSWSIGYNEGENHVVRDAVFFVVDIPEVGDDILPVYMVLDESVYDYEAFIG